MNSINGQVAVVTWGARGIGQALAIEMARRGAACIAREKEIQEELYNLNVRMDQLEASRGALSAEVRRAVEIIEPNIIQKLMPLSMAYNKFWVEWWNLFIS